jgi:predicted helicase
MNFNQVIKRQRELAFSERNKGDRFEKLIQLYLFTDPKYAGRFTKVWLWTEFPFKMNFGGQDTGIDLVALTVEGHYWAIQCKCYQEDAVIDKAEVDTFLSTSSRSFMDGTEERITFSQRLWISTTNNWTSNAEESLRNQTPQVTRINLSDLQESAVDWEKIERGVFGEQARLSKKDLRPHQSQALHLTLEYFKQRDRGKLIMACGTGKTFTSLRIAEKVAGENGIVLFLVPSIALLGQTLREWTADAMGDINPICICSDAEITKDKKRNEDTDTFSVVDLALPASTRVDDILKQFEQIEMSNKSGMTVVLSTYQSIDVISKTQKRLESIGSKFSKFDLIICDEAHRTTGVTLSGDDETAFVKVHNNDFLNASKRLYMTATPRLYGEESKSKAAQSNAILCSMDDEALYGNEIYRIGFGEAVEHGLLTDYKVLILTLSDKDITPEVQNIIQGESNEISTDDLSKLIGCVNAMSKQIVGDKNFLDANDPEPMRRAVAFCQSIKVSKKITDTFNVTSGVYKESVPELKQRTMINLKSQHIDGGMSATTRDQLMSWLKAETTDLLEARVLTNVRCLSEGVDVPSLDAVMFLSAKNSQIDVVQSVGRVMRRSPNKKYGYIIIPIVVPSDIEPEKALDNNDRYKVVWTVLNALRAHDDRFNAIVNKIELNKNTPEQIIVGRVDPDGDGNEFNDNKSSKEKRKEADQQIKMHFEKLSSVIYAKLVQKVGDRHYWETWAKGVAEIAEKQIKRIHKIVSQGGSHREQFSDFLRGLQKNINPSITEEQAIEMLSQHIITKPIFDALFEKYSFVKNNAVSVSMQEILDVIEASALEKEDEKLLAEFYTSVKRRVEGIDNAEGKQRIIVELYDKFFKVAFPKMVERLGIVYTPVEVVDFIIHSVNDVLKKEFGKTLSDENVNILDPFTGTGTFITRLLQSGLISRDDLPRKYQKEIFANEIVLLAYYIAAVNIENTYHDIVSSDTYESFDGITLTDTFQISENDDPRLISNSLMENSERVKKQKDVPIQVIIGNPPYSIGQKSANDNAQNQKYPKLDSRIERTYASQSKAGLKKALYDAYIKAFRWSTDRIDQSIGGIICFISNGKWLETNSADGFRKSIEKEFDTIYVFDLRGDQRGDWRKEGGKIFGEGSQNRIAITLLVKNPSKQVEKATIHYHDVGDYLSREEKLKIIKDFKSIDNEKMIWKKLMPNNSGDWISQRNESFEGLIPIAPEKKFNSKSESFFTTYAIGVATNRDAWVYNFSKEAISKNMRSMINFYNSQRNSNGMKLTKNNIDEIIDSDPTKISWTVNLKNDLLRLIKHDYNDISFRISTYRPFTKEILYFDRPFIERPGLSFKIFPTPNTKNLLIAISGGGGFSTLITSSITNLDSISKTQCFPLYYYEEQEKNALSLFENTEDTFVRKDGISEFIFDQVKRKYSAMNISKEDIFYYVYGILHSTDYRTTFANDLKKMLPRIPFVDDVLDFWAFSNAGRKLGELHVNYEKVPPYEGLKVSGTQHAKYEVTKMKFLAKDRKDTIVYNDYVKIENIPAEAYEYVVNGKSAIEWILERYQTKTDKDSGITNDPNDWGKEHGNPRYILDLLLSIVNVSFQTVDIVNSLPKLDFTEKS